MGLGNWMMKKGAPGQAAKVMAKMYVNSKLKNPEKPNASHLLEILFLRWAMVPLPGNMERLRYTLPAVKAHLAEGNSFGLADLVVVILKSETDTSGVELDVYSVVKDVLRSEGIPQSDVIGAPIDKKTLKAVLSDFPDA